MKHALTILAWLIILALLVVGLRVARADAGPEDVVRETVDLVEVNTVWDHRGEITFPQVIFRRWEYRAGEWGYYACDYRLLRKGEMWPQRNWTNNGRYTMRWQDAGVMREVSAPVLSITDTQYDPEVLEREIHPKENRTELRK